MTPIVRLNPGYYTLFGNSRFIVLYFFKSCQLIGNGTFGDFALNTQSCALFSASVKKGFFMCMFILDYLCFL